MIDKKIQSTEEAEQSIKDTFKTLGLNEDGSLKALKENPYRKISNDFKSAIADSVKEDNSKKEDIKEKLEEEVTADNVDEIELGAEEEQGEEVQETQKDETAELLREMRAEIAELKNNLSNHKQNEYQLNIDDLNNKIAQARDVNTANALHQQKVMLAGNNFIKLNPWYNGTSAKELKMIAAANDYDRILAGRKVPVEKALDLVASHIREEFPDYFNKNNTETKKVAAVESNSGAGVAKVPKKKYNASNLNSEAKFIAKEFARMKVITTDKYAEALAKEGLLK